MKEHDFITSDGARLNYLEAGAGDVLLMLPGAGISANVFEFQIQALSQQRRVISLDKRGHGNSEKVEYGYRVPRFAKDLHDLIVHLNVDKVSLLGHSLGASTIYNYIDIFGTGKIEKFIVVDEPPVLLINPAWSNQECEQYGAIYSAADLHALTNSFVTQDSDALNKMIIDKMTTPTATAEQKAMILKCMSIPGSAAAQLYFNNICQDFRDVILKIDVPTLFITGKGSLHPWQSHQWMQQHVPGSRLEVFAETEGGNHFMFVENPQKFNTVVSGFLNT